MTRSYRRSRFASSARWFARTSGHPRVFLLAVAAIAIWIATGPIFGFSDTWQIAINTSTTIITFLMVFLIQNTQNRDTDAIQIKLDEVIRAIEGAHNALLDLEELSDEEIAEIRASYEELARVARQALQAGRPDTGTPDIGRRKT
jgi:low affinity Fe/Cu permease